jgi:hypothetical protein
MRPTARRGTRRAGVALAFALLLAGCGSRPNPTPSPSSALSLPALRLRVLHALGGHLDYCDPDLYPVGIDDPVVAAKRRLPLIREDQAAWRAILSFEHLDPAHLSDQDLVRVNDDYKQIQIIQLRPQGDGFRFVIRVGVNPPGQTGIEAEGTVSGDGRVQVEQHHRETNLACPICLARDTPIDTPNGPVSVQDVAVGMRVWTTDRRGRRIVRQVVATASLRALPGQQIVVVVLADGRRLVASARHPVGDGRLVGELRPGDELGGSTVASAVSVAYGGGSTFDLLPSGPTGTYFVDGIRLGSTLTRPGQAEPRRRPPR